MSSSPLSTSQPPVTRFVQAGSHRVCYVEGGDDAPAGGALPKTKLLLVHGWIASHKLYRKCFGGIGEMAH